MEWHLGRFGSQPDHGLAALLKPAANHYPGLSVDVYVGNYDLLYHEHLLPHRMVAASHIAPHPFGAFADSDFLVLSFPLA